MLLRTQLNCNSQSDCGNHSDCITKLDCDTHPDYTPVSAVSDVRLRIFVSTGLRG
jgi:hypothetical protein